MPLFERNTDRQTTRKSREPFYKVRSAVVRVGKTYNLLIKSNGIKERKKAAREAILKESKFFQRSQTRGGSGKAQTVVTYESLQNANRVD
jgi:hypothetical protein